MGELVWFDDRSELWHLIRLEMTESERLYHAASDPEFWKAACNLEAGLGKMKHKRKAYFQRMGRDMDET